MAINLRRSTRSVWVGVRRERSREAESGSGKVRKVMGAAGMGRREGSELVRTSRRVNQVNGRQKDGERHTFVFCARPEVIDTNGIDPIMRKSDVEGRAFRP